MKLNRAVLYSSVIVFGLFAGSLFQYYPSAPMASGKTGGLANTYVEYTSLIAHHDSLLEHLNRLGRLSTRSTAYAQDVNFTTTNSGAAAMMMSTQDGIVQTAVRLHAMGFQACTYTCTYGGVGSHQTFCKSNNVNLCPSLFSNPQNPAVPNMMSIYSTNGIDINHTSSPAATVFLGNTTFNSGIGAGQYHHIYNAQAGQCGGTANGTVYNPNHTPNNNLWTIHCP